MSWVLLHFPTQVTAMLYEIEISWQVRKCFNQIWKPQKLYVTKLSNNNIDDDDDDNTIR